MLWLVLIVVVVGFNGALHYLRGQPSLPRRKVDPAAQ